MVKVSAQLSYIWGSKGPKNPKKGPFHGHIPNANQCNAIIAKNFRHF